MWIGFPVRVDNTSRWARDLWVVKRRNSGAGAAIMWFAVVLLLGSCLEYISFDFADSKKFSRLIGTPLLMASLLWPEGNLKTLTGTERSYEVQYSYFSRLCTREVGRIIFNSFYCLA